MRELYFFLKTLVKMQNKIRFKYLNKFLYKFMILQPKKTKYKKMQKGKLTKLNFRSNKPKRNFNTISNLFATKTAASFLSSSWGTFLIVGFAVVSVG